jgi:hypothetical protein
MQADGIQRDSDQFGPPGAGSAMDRVGHSITMEADQSNNPTWIRIHDDSLSVTVHALHQPVPRILGNIKRR